MARRKSPKPAQPEPPPQPKLKVTVKQSPAATPEAWADLAEFIFGALKRVRERRKREAEAEEHHDDAA